MTTSKKTIPILMAMLLMLTSILAQTASAELVINKYTNEFAAASPYNEQLKLCQCETKVDRIVIENVGQFYANFHLDVNSDYPRVIRVTQNDFDIAPKHFQEVLVYIEDSCGLQGVWNYDVVITNSYGRTQTISRTIRVDHCENAQLEVTPYNQTVGLCERATYNATIRNVGTFADTFYLSYGQYDSVAQPQNRAVYLMPDQAYSQNVDFRFACTEWGQRTIPFILSTEKNGPGAMLTRGLTIKNEYDYTIDMPTDASVCAQTTSAITIDVRNNAPVTDKISFALDAPIFAALDNKELSLESEERKSLVMTLSPKKGDEGTHTLKLYSNDLYGNVNKERSTKLEVSNCYDPAIEMRSNPTTLITTPLAMCCGPATFYVNVQNNGDREVVYQLYVDGPTFFSLDETSVRLAPHQNANIALRATMPCADETYSASVIAYPQGQPQVNVSASVTINSQTQRTCHMVQIDDDELEITRETRITPVIVKHTGIEGGIYDITVNNTLFTILEQNISLYPGDQRAIHIVAKANLSVQEFGRYIVQPVFTLEELNIPYNEHVGLDLQDKSLWQKFVDWFFGLPWGELGFCGWMVFVWLAVLIILIVLLLLIYFGVIGFHDGVARHTLTVLKTLLLLLAIVLIVALALVRWPSDEMRYERVANTTDSTVVEWYQNTQKQLDVNQYFTDPDMDVLYYSITQPRDIGARIDGKILTLTPDHNFVGENTMVITANDNKGGVTDSPVFILRVIPQKHLSFFSWIAVWCHQINLLLLILITLVLFLVVLAVPEKRGNDKNKNVIVVVQKPKSAVQRSARRSSISASTTKQVKKQNAQIKTQVNAQNRKQIKKQTGTKKIATRFAARKTTAKTAKGVKSTKGMKSKRVIVKTTRPAKGVVIKETKAGDKTVNIEVNAPSVPAQQAPTIVTVPGMKPSEIIYVGMKGGNTVHTPYCMNARRIPRGKRVAFTTKKEAVNAGLVPCRMCRPFEGGM